MEGKYDPNEGFSADQLGNIRTWCGEFPVDLDNPVIPFACVDLSGANYKMPDRETVRMLF
eukprot:COSAG02_NODE_20551_length_826_cov_0.881706_1_plen_59_part_10